MKNAELSFNPGIPNPRKEEEQPETENPAQKRQKRKIERIQKQKQQLDKKIHELKKILAKKVISKYLSAQNNPNDDPQYLWGQIRPTLGRMGINNICQNNKTQLVVGETEGDNSLYRILLRRQAQIDSDIIDRLRRQKDNLKYIIWSNDGIVVYVWAPYIAPAAEAPEEEAPAP